MKIPGLVALLLLSACSGDIYLRDGVTDGDTFYLAPVATTDNDPVLQSWVAYSLALSTCQLGLPGENPGRLSVYRCEFLARKVLAESWADHRAQHPELHDDYLDTLLGVYEAGYLDEYTVQYFGQREWEVPESLEVVAFEKWRRQHIRRHRPKTRIIGYWGYGPDYGSSDAR